MRVMLQIFLWLIITTIAVRCQSLNGANVIVTSILETPYTMLRDIPQSNLTGNDRYEGYIVDLVDAISKNLNFTYVLKVNEAGKFGSLDQSGRWTGMIGEVIDGRADIAAASLTITAEREQAVDFTIPFMNLGIVVIHKIHISEGNMFDDLADIFYPFANYATDTFLLLTFVLGVILLALRRKHKTIVFRTLLGFWLLFRFIFASLYIAQLTSYYIMCSRESKIEEFRTIEELVSQSQVVYGCIRGGSTESFFRHSTSPTYRKMWLRMSAADPSPFVYTSADGIERVQGGYAFIAESTVIEYATARNCDLYQVCENINSKGYGLAVKQGSSMRESLSYAILALQEQSALLKLKNKWWKDQRGGD